MWALSVVGSLFIVVGYRKSVLNKTFEIVAATWAASHGGNRNHYVVHVIVKKLVFFHVLTYIYIFFVRVHL